MKGNASRIAMTVVPVIAFVLTSLYIPQAKDFFVQAKLASVQLNMPIHAMENLKTDIASNTGGENEQTTNATSEETESGEDKEENEADEVMKRTPGDAVTATPEDILKLQKQAEEAIKSEAKAGNITEEPYTGGGKIVNWGDIKVQSKIPEDFYQLNIEKLLSMNTDLSIEDKSKPTVLIYHSHTTEAYQMLDVGYYTASFKQRCDDIAQNMVRVGDEITAVLTKNGFNVIHDRQIYDKNYNASYGLSDVSIKKYLEQYPTIDVTIDVHRDAIEYKDGTKVKPVIEINGKKAAKMMIIAGCEYGSIKNFPDWESNLRFDLQLQQKAEKMYPGLMRPILFSARRYNMFETPYSFLLEVGSDGNTLDEACYSGRLMGTVLSELLNDYVKK